MAEVWFKLGGAAEHLNDFSENAFFGLALNFRVHMSLKGAVNKLKSDIFKVIYGKCE